jgi:hypothetical protein
MVNTLCRPYSDFFVLFDYTEPQPFFPRSGCFLAVSHAGRIFPSSIQYDAFSSRTPQHLGAFITEEIDAGRGMMNQSAASCRYELGSPPCPRLPHRYIRPLDCVWM